MNNSMKEHWNEIYEALDVDELTYLYPLSPYRHFILYASAARIKVTALFLTKSWKIHR